MGHLGIIHGITVQNLKPVVPEKIIHVVKIPVAAVNPFEIISLVPEYGTYGLQMLISFLAKDGHAGKRRQGCADCFQPAYGTGARGISIREKNAFLSQTAQARSDVSPVFPALVQKFRSHTLHDHNHDIRADSPPGRTHLPLYAAGRSLRHGRVIRRELPGQKRRRFRIRQRPVISAVIQFILEKGAEQAVKAILGHFRIITVVHGIRILDIHQPISPRDAGQQEQHHTASFPSGGNRPVPGKQEPLHSPDGQNGRRQNAAQNRNDGIGLVNIPDNLLGVNQVIHRNEIEAGFKLVPEKSFRHIFKQIGEHKQEKPCGGEPPVRLPSCFPARQNPQINGIGNKPVAHGDGKLRHKNVRRFQEGKQPEIHVAVFEKYRKQIFHRLNAERKQEERPKPPPIITNHHYRKYDSRSMPSMLHHNITVIWMSFQGNET